MDILFKPNTISIILTVVKKSHQASGRFVSSKIWMKQAIIKQNWKKVLFVSFE